jgi:drug/metabolite transporter (DMT)-like permease
MRISEIAELILLAALWGGSFLFMRIAAPEFGAIWLIELRVLLAGLVLLPILISVKPGAEVKRNLVPLFVLGCINSALPFSLLAFSSIFLPAGFTSILNATSPIFGTLVGFVWLQERFTMQRMIGFILGFAGVLILVGWRSFETTPSFLVAVFAGLLAGFLYAIGATFAKQKLSGVPSIVTATVSQLSAAFFLLPALPFTVPKAIPSSLSFFSVVILAVFSTAFAYILYFRLINQVGASRALTVGYLIPLFAMVWGAIVLKEPISSGMIFGCGLILLGTAIANGFIKTALEKPS